MMMKKFFAAALVAACTCAAAQASWPTRPVKSDLQKVMVAGSSGLLVGAHPSIGFKSLNDLVTAGKTKGLTFSSVGSGSPGHFAAEMFIEATGMKITHVTYKGNTPAVTAVVSGEVNAGVLATPGMLPHVKAGKINALAVTSRKCSPMAPDVPTVADAGLPHLEQEVLYVVMVPGATPPGIVLAMQQAIGDALARADVRARIEGTDLHYEGLTGSDAARRLAELSNRYGKVVRATGIKAE